MDNTAHPYVPNSAQEVQQSMLAVIGAQSMDDLYAAIPEALRFRGRMDLPPAMVSEFELRRHVDGLLARNRSCGDLLSFRGGGCAQHYVPAVCDEVNRRSEFLTAYAGEPYEDHGRFQTLFEYASLMGELLDLDVVNVPTFDWNQAAATSIRMAQRITERTAMLYSETISPQRLSTIRNYCRSSMALIPVRHDRQGGALDVSDLQAKLSGDSIGMYFENPGYLGLIEDQGRRIADVVHEAGGLLIVGVDPISLGVLTPPVHYGADITCGDLQPLGIHMNHGGGQAGFIASRDEPRFVREYPSRLFGITETDTPGQWGFGDVLYDERTSFGAREKGKEFVGTATALWGITAGVYLALMGPQGMVQVGRTIMQTCRYAMEKLASIDSVAVRAASRPHFKEFVVDLSGAAMSPAEVNAELLKQDIIGGIDLTGPLSGFDRCLLMCVTEVHSADDIDRLAGAIADVLAAAR